MPRTFCHTSESGVIGKLDGTVCFGVFIFFLRLLKPWYMPLFFVLAGWSVFWSLQARGSRHFLKQRVQKLVIPLGVGCVIFGLPIKYLPVGGWYGRLWLGFHRSAARVCAQSPGAH